MNQVWGKHSKHLQKKLHMRLRKIIFFSYFERAAHELGRFKIIRINVSSYPSVGFYILCSRNLVNLVEPS